MSEHLNDVKRPGKRFSKNVRVCERARARACMCVCVCECCKGGNNFITFKKMRFEIIL